MEKIVLAKSTGLLGKCLFQTDRSRTIARSVLLKVAEEGETDASDKGDVKFYLPMSTVMVYEPRPRAEATIGNLT